MKHNHRHIAASLLLAISGSIWTVATAATGQTGVEPPTVPFKYALGVEKFQAGCGGCHGKWAEGTKSGPPLLHPFYKPSHHPDAAFYRAVSNGVQAHHWGFGDMPPVSGINQKEVAAIISFIRWLQKERGIYQE